MRRVALLSALLLLAPAAHATKITVGTVSAAAGSTVSVPLVLASEGTSVAAVQVELAFGDPLSYVDVAISAAASTAGKQISATSISGGIRVTVYGTTATAIPDGTFGTVSFSIFPVAAPGSYPVNAVHAQGADLNGMPVAVTQASGSVNVGGSAATWILPSSAHVSGANFAFWTTDLVVANTGNLDAMLTVKFLGHDADGRTGPSFDVPVNAGRTAVLTDVLSYYGLSAGYGALLLSSSVTTLAISGQTSTPGVACTGGTYGQSVPAVSSADFITPGKPRSLVGVRQDSDFHTNVMLANGGQAGCDVDLKLVLQNGTLAGSKRYTLQPLGMTQVPDVPRALGVTAEVTGARVVVAPVTSGATVAAYASVINNKTNDPRTLVAQ